MQGCTALLLFLQLAHGPHLLVCEQQSSVDSVEVSRIAEQLLEDVGVSLPRVQGRQSSHGEVETFPHKAVRALKVALRGHRKHSDGLPEQSLEGRDSFFATFDAFNAPSYDAGSPLTSSWGLDHKPVLDETPGESTKESLLPIQPEDTSSVWNVQRPCDGRSFPWCDHSRPFEERVTTLVANLTNEEKAVLFTNQAGGIGRIGWPPYQWWNEALHGVARNGRATSFPQVCGVAASYNRSLWHAIGKATSTEGRGKHRQHAVKAGLTFWAPNINIFRDPRWGRGQETPGEDPTVNGEYAVAFVRGMQGNHSKYLKVSSSLKHYASYSMESGRESFAAMVTAQDMEDTYLPAFQAGVEVGKASSIMCSYSAESYGYGIYGNGEQNGAIPSCANKGIINDLARAKWGFEGYVTSDCGGVEDVRYAHGYTHDAYETVKAVLSAGMDLECGRFMLADVMRSLLQRPDVSQLADAALKHLLMVQFRLGFADPISVQPDWATYDSSVVDTAEHRALAKTAADQSLVLLKNAAGCYTVNTADSPACKSLTLPLQQSLYPQLQIAVVGREANAARNMQGDYFGDAPVLTSPAMGFAAYGSVTSNDGSDIAGSVAEVAGKDAVVLVVGLQSAGAKPADEDENHDRTSLRLPGNQDELVARVAAAAAQAKVPVVVVVMSGGPLDISTIKADPNVGAIIWCGYPGQSGGDSIADVVFGEVNPSAKLTMTWYKEEFTKQARMADMGMRPNHASGSPGRSYRFYTGSPVFHFGEGLSYSTFKSTLEAPSHISAEQFPRDLSLSSLTKVAIAKLWVTTANLSERDGSEAILVFAASPNAGGNGAPLQSLIAFEKVHVAAHTSLKTGFEVGSQHFALAGIDGVREIAKGAWKLWVGFDGKEHAITVTIA